MAGSVWRFLLEDLEAEARSQSGAAAETERWRSAAEAIRALMAGRAERWSKQAFPFGSEMPWDSTGQEEVFGWTRLFGYYIQSNATLDAVLAYTPHAGIGSWAYHGNARRYFDFLVYGSPAMNRGTEREFHHYGAPLNALVVLDSFRSAPDDMYLLEVGVGAMANTLTNINATDGLASMAWHGSPALLARDDYDCDYGVGFFGHAVGASSFVVGGFDGGAMPACYLCNAVRATKPGGILIQPLDSFKRRMYLAALGLDILLEVGRMESVTLQDGRVTVVIDTGSAAVLPPRARLRLEAPGSHAGPRAFDGFHARDSAGATLPLVRGAYELPVRAGKHASFVIGWTAEAEQQQHARGGAAGRFSSSAGGATAAEAEQQSSVDLRTSEWTQLAWPTSGRKYAYAFDIVEHEGTRYAWYCGNTEGGVIRDSIMLRKGTFDAASKSWVYSPDEVVAMTHGGGGGNRVGGWDAEHTCDCLLYTSPSPRDA